MFARISRCDQEKLRQLLDGNLSESAQTEIASHIETCPTCQQQMESFAADASWWKETRFVLSQVDLEHRSEFDDWSPTAFGETTRPSVPLDFLSPSDNPGMLGRLGEFEILEEIGCGGMGIVLKGYDHELNRYVAVKVLHPFCATSAAARKRFVREAQAAAAIVHQHVVAIHAVDPHHHPPYLVMPFVPGESLQERLNRLGPLELLDVVRIGQQVAEGLAAAHAQGLVHRDIKPGNILLERNVERVLLTDFGLARAADDASLTRSGVIAGTPQFMSPEQARGDEIDHRTDLFSLGSVLYTLLAGHSPFRAESAMGVLRRVCEDTPRPLREINPHVPEWMEAIIRKLQSKQPADRFDSAGQLATLLQGCLAHLQQPTLAVLPDEIRKLSRPTSFGRHRYWTMAASFTALGTVFLTVLVLASATGRPLNPFHDSTEQQPISDQKVSVGSMPPHSPSVTEASPHRWDDQAQHEVDQIRDQLEIWEADSTF